VSGSVFAYSEMLHMLFPCTSFQLSRDNSCVFCGVVLIVAFLSYNEDYLVESLFICLVALNSVKAY
jgi:hypothetical protein